MSRKTDKKCPRIIHPSKYESQNKETFDWWLRLFEIMENEITIPEYKRKEVLQKIFPVEVWKKIISTIMIEKQDGNKKSDDTSVSSRYTFNKSNPSREDIQQVEHEDDYDYDYLYRLTTLQTSRRDAGPNNPYLRFFKRHPDRAAIWREIPPIPLDEMNLAQKSEAITEAIAVDFINWLKNLGGETETTLDLPQVLKMFEIGFNTHAATSLIVKVKEMPAVPKMIAERRGQPQKAVRAKLSTKLHEDVRAFKKKTKVLAFNAALPMNLRYVPPKENVAAKWLQINAPKDLQTMSTVWKGITHLRATRAFCQWLVRHPHLPRPIYLEEQGMMHTSFFDKPHYSIESEDSDAFGGLHVTASDVIEKRFD